MKVISKSTFGLLAFGVTLLAIDTANLPESFINEANARIGRPSNTSKLRRRGETDDSPYRLRDCGCCYDSSSCYCRRRQSARYRR